MCFIQSSEFMEAKLIGKFIIFGKVYFDYRSGRICGAFGVEACFVDRQGNS